MTAPAVWQSCLRVVWRGYLATQHNKLQYYDYFQINAKVKQVFDKYRQNGVRCKFFVEKLGERGDN